MSCYELEAKPGTRFTHAHGAELERQAESMESYFERVVAAPDGRRLPLVRDGELLPVKRTAAISGRGTTSAYWLGRDYLGLGIGAVSTIEGRPPAERAAARPVPRRARRRAARRRASSSLSTTAPVAASGSCSASGWTSRCSLGGLEDAVDVDAIDRLERLGLAVRAGANGDETLALTERGRFLGGGVTADLLA